MMIGNGLVTNKTKQKNKEKRKKNLRKIEQYYFSETRKELSINSENIKYLEKYYS